VTAPMQANLFDPPPAPRRASFRTDRVGWAIQYLQDNRHVYQEFRRQCDRWRRNDPTRETSADMVAHHIRFETGIQEASSDGWKVNNNATSLFARLYLSERPGANFDTRDSEWDKLPAHEWERILAVLRSDS
jgi:hypothetical protein